MYSRCLQYLGRVLTTEPTCLLRTQCRPCACGTRCRLMSSETVHTDQFQEEELNYDNLHTSVFADKVVDLLNPQDNQVFVDMTFGAGGHTRRLLQAAPKCRVYCLDRDPFAINIARKMSQHNSQIIPLHGKYSDVHKLLHDHKVGMSSVDGILFDCGTSSMQFDSADRGFALSKDSELDMRMDNSSSDPDQITAADVVNNLSENGLFQIIKKYGEEKYARDIARAIVDSRYAFGKITTTKQLAKIVQSAVGVSHQSDSLQRPAHSATKTFMAIRIFVNNELNELYNALEIAWHLLKPDGICVALSFHSLEDRIIKRHFHGIDMDADFNLSLNHQARNFGKMSSKECIEKLVEGRWDPLSKKIIVPSEEEILMNPRARSAKLRAARKSVDNQKSKT